MAEQKVREKNAHAHAEHLASAIVKAVPKYAVSHANIYSWAYNSYLAGWDDREATAQVALIES